MNKIVLFIFIVVVVVFGILFVANITKENPNKKDTIPPLPSINPIISSTLDQTTPKVNLTPTPTFIPMTNASKAIIKSTKGNIEIVFYSKDAPKTVTNFATLAKNGYYTNLTFHRVEDWVIQGGDPTGSGAGGYSIYGETFEDELNASTSSYKEGYKEGVVAMANRGPNTNGSQFFILTKDYPLDPNYTIFGKVTKGMDVVKQIQKGDKMTEVIIN